MAINSHPVAEVTKIEDTNPNYILELEEYIECELCKTIKFFAVFIVISFLVMISSRLLLPDNLAIPLIIINAILLFISLISFMHFIDYLDNGVKMLPSGYDLFLPMCEYEAPFCAFEF